MRLPHSARRRFAAFALLALVGAGIAGRAAAQSPGGLGSGPGASSSHGQAGRAFWGIPALPPQRTPSVSVPPISATPVSAAPVSATSILPPPVQAGFSTAYDRVAAHPLREVYSSRHLPGNHGTGCDGCETCGSNWSEPGHGLWTVATETVQPAPFPYGYFGANHNRHWQRHFGFRQAYTQWTLK